MTMQEIEERNPKLREIRERGERVDALVALLRGKFSSLDCGVFKLGVSGPAEHVVHVDLLAEKEPTEVMTVDPVLNHLAGYLDDQGIKLERVVAVAKALIKAEYGKLFVWAVWYN